MANIDKARDLAENKANAKLDLVFDLGGVYVFTNPLKRGSRYVVKYDLMRETFTIIRYTKSIAIDEYIVSQRALGFKLYNHPNYIDGNLINEMVRLSKV